MAPDPRLRAWLIALLLLGATPLAHAQPTSGNGVLVSAAPIYLTPDPTRTPLATLPFGTLVRVLAKEGDWYKVVFSDRYLGDRTGYVLAVNIRIEPPAPAAAAPRPAVPGQIAAPAAPTQPVIVGATPMKKPKEHGYLWLNGTYQRESTAFTAATTFTQNSGIANVTTSYGGVQSAVADVAVGQRVWRSLSVAVAATWSSQITDADVSATSPHPLGGAPRAVSGVASAIRRQELGIHLDASWSVPANGRAQLVIFAGPTLYRVKQGLVTGVTVNESFPFDTATFASATVVESQKSRIGANGGLEASVRLWKAFGIGGIARFSRAMIPFAPAEGAGVTIRAGGLQVGGGLHFRF